MSMLAVCSLTRSLQSTEKRVFVNGTNRHKNTHMPHGHCKFETESAERFDSVKIPVHCMKVQYTEPQTMWITAE